MMQTPIGTTPDHAPQSPYDEEGPRERQQRLRAEASGFPSRDEIERRKRDVRKQAAPEPRVKIKSIEMLYIDAEKRGHFQMTVIADQGASAKSLSDAASWAIRWLERRRAE